MSVRSERMDGGMPNIESMNMSDATLSYGMPSDHPSVVVRSSCDLDTNGDAKVRSRRRKGHVVQNYRLEVANVLGSAIE